MITSPPPASKVHDVGVAIVSVDHLRHYFELPYEDRKRAERFYATAFGWETEFLGPDMGDYVLLTTAETDAVPGTPAGAINGGMFPRKPDQPLPSPLVKKLVKTRVAECAALVSTKREEGR